MTGLLTTARKLARANPRKPSQADLKRAISTAYYAVFHVLAKQCADAFAGTGPGRSDKAWNQVDRALEHGFAKNACKQASNLGFPPGIVTFATAFVALQEERHRADYDPESRYSRAQALDFVQQAEQAIQALKGAPTPDRRALAVLVMLKQRG